MTLQPAGDHCYPIWSAHPAPMVRGLSLSYPLCWSFIFEDIFGSSTFVYMDLLKINSWSLLLDPIWSNESDSSMVDPVDTCRLSIFSKSLNEMRHVVLSTSLMPHPYHFVKILCLNSMPISSNTLCQKLKLTLRLQCSFRSVSVSWWTRKCFLVPFYISDIYIV